MLRHWLPEQPWKQRLKPCSWCYTVLAVNTSAWACQRGSHTACWSWCSDAAADLATVRGTHRMGSVAERSVSVVELVLGWMHSHLSCGVRSSHRRVNCAASAAAYTNHSHHHQPQLLHAHALLHLPNQHSINHASSLCCSGFRCHRHGGCACHALHANCTALDSSSHCSQAMANPIEAVAKNVEGPAAVTALRGRRMTAASCGGSGVSLPLASVRHTSTRNARCLIPFPRPRGPLPLTLPEWDQAHGVLLLGPLVALLCLALLRSS